MLKDKSKNFSWYIVHCNSGQEGTVSELIKIRASNAGLSEYIKEIYIPVQEKETFHKGQKKTVQEKLFKGYIFINMVLNDQTWPLVRDTAGVINFTGTDRKPTPVSSKEISSIKEMCEKGNLSLKIDLSVGSKVKIVVGEFKDFAGTVKEIDHEKGRAVVTVQFLNREVDVEVDVLSISPL